MLEIHRTTTDIFYLDDRLNNGECHLDWIRTIEIIRQLLEEHLREPRGYSNILFCSRVRHMGMGRRWFFSTSRSKVGVGAMLFEVCSEVDSQMRRLIVLQPHLEGRDPADLERLMKEVSLTGRGVDLNGGLSPPDL